MTLINRDLIPQELDIHEQGQWLQVDLGFTNLQPSPWRQVVTSNSLEETIQVTIKP